LNAFDHSRLRTRRLVIGVVLMLHFALLWVVDRASRTQGTRTHGALVATSRVTLRLITEPHAVAMAPVVAAAPPPAREATAPNRTRSSRPPRKGPSAPTAIAEPPIEAALRAGPPASAPDGAGPLLDSEASRRAIRASARMPSLNEQLAHAREEPDRLSSQQRLANGMMSAGKGDCLKGEFAGAGMGLLSLPFLGLAAVSGNCTK
jgi:hypothetical protein